MDLVLKLKHWHLFLTFIIPGYLIDNLGIFPIVVFELIIYSLWFYSISRLCYIKIDEKNHERVPITLITSFILLPLLWVVSYLSIPVISAMSSALWIATLFIIILFTTKALKEVGADVKPVWIAIGFLLPFIGVWYIQPMINRLYQKQII